MDSFTESSLFAFNESTVFERIQSGIDFSEAITWLYGKCSWVPRYGYLTDLAGTGTLNNVAQSAQITATRRAADGTYRRYGQVVMVVDSTTYTGVPNGSWGDPNQRVDTTTWTMTAYEGVTGYSTETAGANDPGVYRQYTLVDTYETVTNTDNSVVFRHTERFGQDDGEGGTFINEDRITTVTFTSYRSAAAFDAEAWSLYGQMAELDDQEQVLLYRSRDDDNAAVTDAPPWNWKGYTPPPETLDPNYAAGWAAYETDSDLDCYSYSGAAWSVVAEQWHVITRTYNIACTLLSTATFEMQPRYSGSSPRFFIDADGSHRHRTIALCNP